MAGYNIKLRLKNFRPITWRDLIIPTGLTFHDVHLIIQIVFGFADSHLYHFVFKDSPVTLIDFERQEKFFDDDYNSHDILIDDFFNKYKKIEYEYDFGDGWEILVEIKGIKEDFDKNYPELIRYKGKYDCMEDIGGFWGLSQLIYFKEHPDDPNFSEPFISLMEDFSIFDFDLTQKALKDYF